MCFSVLTLECLCSCHNWVSGTILIGLSTMQAWQISSKWKKKKKKPLSISSEKLTRVSNMLQWRCQTGQRRQPLWRDQEEMRETFWDWDRIACVSFFSFPHGSDGKESTCQRRRLSFHPWVGKILWSRKQQPTPVFSPGKSHGQRSLEGYSPWGHKD